MKIRIQCPRCDVNGVNKHIIVHNTTFDDRSNSLHSHMEIDSLELEDSGEYMCTLTFEGREETLETRTELHVAPQKAQIQVIERSPQILRVHEDKEIFLSAKFAMYPTDGESYVAKWSRRYNSSIKGGTQSETLINDKTHTISTKTFENGNVLESLTMNGTVKAFMSGTYVLSISLLDTVQVVQWEVAIENDRPDVQITVREPSSFIVFNQLFYPPDTHLHVDCISVSIPPADVVFEKKNSESSEFEEIGGDSLLRVDGTFEKGFVWNMMLDEVTELRCSSEKHGKKSTTTKKIIAAEEALHIVSDIKKSKKASKLEDPKLIYEGDHVQLACVVPIGAVDWDVTWNFVGSSSPETASLPRCYCWIYRKYVCVVKKDNSEELLEIVVDIEPTSKPYHTKADSRHVVNVEFDHDFELDCHMAGSPPPEYIWFKDGNHYTVGVQDGSVLKVTRARAEDDGQFHCLAMNRAGSTNHFMEVQVEGAPKGSSFYYKLSALIIFIFLVAVVFLVWKLRKTRRETKQKDIKLAELSSMLLSENVGPVPEELKELPIEERAYYLPYRKTEYEIDPNNLELLEVLGQGNFGVVRKGYLQMADPKSQIEYKTRLPVAVKSSIDPYNLAQQKMIAEELKVMCAIDKHPNVLALIGGVTANMRKGQLLIVTEYIDGGELRGLLRKTKPLLSMNLSKMKYQLMTKSSLETEKLLSDNNSNFLSTSDLLSFALQIANGMEFLARVPCVHRDLACRNILVTKTKIIRVADFGLAKKHSNKTYYRVKNIKDTQMPVRWMAPESLQNHTYTQKSDVWSFGICLYEIFSLGNLPYPNVINVVDVFDYIVQGHINSQPEYCHEEMYELMKLCWQSSPEDRPPFSACVQYLKSHMNNNAAEKEIEIEPRTMRIE
uniref:receptor protein-tyrosine kinase n=1 Tax=Caenorhabditis tropicalis TaxID=1561998 RepID=A0A1I7U1A5_9PELO